MIDRKNLNTSDTLFALASGPLPSAVAILRLSGDASFDFMRQHFVPQNGKWMAARGMAYGDICDEQGQRIDSVVALTFVAPHSFTGQNVVEIQCHGASAIVTRLERLFVDKGMRPAHAGEFSYRALLNGRMSSQSLEHLGDLFHAQDSWDLERLEMRKETSLVREITQIRAELIRLQAILDTAVDFSEEYANVVSASHQPLQAALTQSRELAERYAAFRNNAGVPRLVLAGSPNAGKSSLFNALLCRYRAIVHEAAGTTRDAIEEDIELGGRRWKLVDTAGVRDGESEVERTGLKLGESFLKTAGFWILVVDGTKGISDTERALLQRHGSKPHLTVWNKKDLQGFQPPVGLSGEAVVAVSALTGDSIREFVAVLKEQAIPSNQRPSVLPTSVQAKLLMESADLLEAIARDLSMGVPPEVLGECNRMILRKLESIVGEVSVDDVLDRVFSEFCIGK